MKHLFQWLLCAGALSFWHAASAQDCGFAPTPTQIEYFNQTRAARQSFDAAARAGDRAGADLHWIPVKFHECIATTGALNSLRQTTISDWMGQLNDMFLPYGIQFFECSTYSLFVDATLYNFDNSEEPLLAAYDIPNVINVYYFGSVSVNGSSVGGYSYLPPSADRILINKFGDASYTPKIFFHEMGHFLGLYHTHGKTNYGVTDELVNGSNCLTAGDDVCDTPADPNLLNRMSNCTYTGTALDANNQPYTPDTGNHMSYAPQTCRNHFSVGQMNRMAYTALNDRAYLQGCDHPSACDQPITQLPVVFDFENGLDGWINTSIEGYDQAMIVPFSGVSPVPGTGPNQALSGNGYALFDAANCPVNGGVAIFISPCIDVRGVAAPKVKFNYHSYGNPGAEFGAQVSVDGGHTFAGIPPDNLIFFVSGDQGDSWHSVICDLSSFKTAPALQIRILCQGDNLSEMAFDSIAVYNDPGSLCQLSLQVASANITCYGSANGVIQLTPGGNFTAPMQYAWSNGATTAAIGPLGPGLYTVTATDAAGCSMVHTLPILSPNLLYVNSTQTNVSIYGQSNGSAGAVVFGGNYPYQYVWSNGAGTANISNLAAGVYTVTVSDQNGCTATRSITITQPSVVCAAYHTQFPWASSIEQNLGIFEQVTGIDQFNWTRQSGGTPTSQTGPGSAYNGVYYWYARAQNNTPNKTAMLKTTKCLTLNAMSNPVFEFYYHMYGNQMGSLAVEISMDNEQTWTAVWTVSGNQGNLWKKAVVNLLPYRTDHTKIRIKCTTGSGSRGDMAIDALYVGEAGNNQYLPESTEAGLDMEALLVWPNPSDGQFQVRLPQGSLCERATVYNAAGRMVWEATPVGENFSISLGQQPQGCYFLHLQSGTEINIVRLMLFRE